CTTWILVHRRVVKHSRFESSCWHDRRIGQRCPEALEFFIEKEKCLVLEDRATDGIAKLISHIRVHCRMRPAGIDGGVEPVAGAAETVPTAELVDSAVKGIGTALGHDVDDGAGVAAVFGIEGVGDRKSVV